MINPKNCKTCGHCRETDQHGPDGKVLIGQKSYVCNRLPPNTIVIPNPQGFAMTSIFPTVNETMVCAEHTVIDPETVAAMNLN